MILRHTSFSAIVFVFVVLWCGEANNKLCNHRCGNKTVPFPFGFSNECEIRLSCNSNTSSYSIGEFRVLNITEDYIFVESPAQCSRHMTSLQSLFSSNYAMTLNNSLLLQDCSNASRDCIIPKKFFTESFDFKSCNQSDNVTCLMPGKDRRAGLLTYDDLNRTGCRFLYSSFAVNSGSGSGLFFEFQRLELNWGLPGACSSNSCHANGICTTVQLRNDSLAHRCRCKEGFHGDGFVAGVGCQKSESNFDFIYRI